MTKNKHVKKYIQEFGLTNYDYIPENINELDTELEGTEGALVVHTQARHAHIGLDAQNDKKAAFHEVCELLLAEMKNYLHAFYSFEFVERLSHDVIQRLCNREFK